MFTRDNLLFIQGPEKTGTSSLCGMLNAHPKIFNLFEVYMSQVFISKYGHQLINAYPNSRRFFRDCTDFGAPYLEFFNWFSTREPNFKYHYVGSKINSLDASITQRVHPYKVIFTTRDLRSWLLKESIITRYRTDKDIVMPSISFLKYIINIHRYPHAIRIRMEDMVLDNLGTFDWLAKRLELDFPSEVESWWKKFGTFPEDDPKSVFRLHHVHHSSQIEPGKLDTHYKTSDIPFWHEAVKLFDKYDSRDEDVKFSTLELDDDLKRVEALARFSPLTLEQCYDVYESRRLGDLKSTVLSYSKNNARSDIRTGIITRNLRRIFRKALRIVDN